MKKLLVATAVLAATLSLSSFAMAQETNVGGTEPTDIPGHPRVNEVDRRDNAQQERIDQGEASGRMTSGQAARDQQHLDHEEAQQAHQEADNNGHLRKGEQMRDNRRMNRSSGKIYRQKHGMARRRRRRG